jgi:chemotaxis protein methyltransferase CheR
LNNTSAMDVIFCRNVLMYFTAQRAKQVTSNFYRALLDGGWMIVSPTEASNSLFSPFTPVEFPGAVLYRKMVNAESQMQNPKSRVSDHQVPQSFRETEAAPPLLQVAQTEPVVAVADIRMAQPDQLPALQPDEREVPSRMARSCANQGGLSEALDWCKKAIAADKLNPLHHYLSATILQEQGQHDIAIQSLMRALYLDPDFVLAHFSLGNLHQSQGRYRQAQRYFGNVLVLLRKHPQDEILPEADGLTAGRLAEIVTSLLASLPQPAASA